MIFIVKNIDGFFITNNFRNKNIDETFESEEETIFTKLSAIITMVYWRCVINLLVLKINEHRFENLENKECV